jgi:hypothetical protein
MTLVTTVLPPGFEDLATYASTWGDLPTQEDRYRLRCASSMAQLQAFYGSAVPRLRDVLAYLESRREQGLNDADSRLFRTILGLTEVAQAVEIFGHPDVPGRDDAHSLSIKWIDYSRR